MKTEHYVLQQLLYKELGIKPELISRGQEYIENFYLKFEEEFEQQLKKLEKIYLEIQEQELRQIEAWLEGFSEYYQCYFTKSKYGKKNEVPYSEDCLIPIERFVPFLMIPEEHFEKHKRKVLEMRTYDCFSVFLGFHGHKDFEAKNGKQIQQVRNRWLGIEENSESNEESELKPSKKLPNFLLFLIPVIVIILGGVFYLQWAGAEPKESGLIGHEELGQQFSSTDSNTFKLLILPFKMDTDCEREPSDYEGQFLDRFELIRFEKNLNIEVQFVEKTSCITRYYQAEQIIDSSDIDMIIWGRYEEDCEEGKEICLNYSLAQSKLKQAKELNYFKASGSTGLKSLNSMEQLRSGYLQEDIDNIIFWVVANYYADKFQYEKALEIIESIIRPEECNTKVLYTASNWAYNLKRNKRALELIKSTLSCKLFGSPMPDISEEELLDSKKMDSSLFWNWMHFGAVLDQIDYGSELAFRAYEKAYKVDKGTYALDKLGGLHSWDDKEKSIQYSQLLIKKTKAKRYVVLLGFKYYLLKQYEKSIETLNRAIKEDSTDHLSYTILSQIYEKKENMPLAMHYIEKAVNVTPDETVGWNIKGNLHFKLKEYQEAITCFDRSIEIEPKFSTTPHIEKAEVCERLGRLDESVSTLESGKNLNPKSISILTPLGRYYILMGRIEQAEKCANEALSMYKESNHISFFSKNHIVLGHCELLNNKDSVAIEKYKFALKDLDNELEQEILEQFKSDFQYLKSFDVTKERYEFILKGLEGFCAKKEYL